MDLNGLPLALANGIGVVGVVLLVGWLIWSGRLIPKSTHDAHIALLTQQLEDEQHTSGEWRTESRLKDQTIVELTDQNDMLKEFGRTLVDFLNSLRRAGVGAVESGDRK